MKGRLIKTDVNYILEDDKRVVIASTSLKKEGLSLSLKNCQSIELGYDLGELAKREYLDGYDTTELCRAAFKDGFQKALELMGDKKFSEFDITKAFEYGWNQRHFDKTDEDELREIQKRFIQSLQQNEWDVEVVMTKEEYTWSPRGEGFEDQTYRDWREVPKLDADGCLILKRI